MEILSNTERCLIHDSNERRPWGTTQIPTHVEMRTMSGIFRLTGRMRSLDRLSIVACEGQTCGLQVGTRTTGSGSKSIARNWLPPLSKEPD